MRLCQSFSGRIDIHVVPWSPGLQSAILFVSNGSCIHIQRLGYCGSCEEMKHMVVGQKLRYLFGDGYHPNKVVYFKGFWKRSLGYRGFDPSSQKLPRPGAQRLQTAPPRTSVLWQTSLSSWAFSSARLGIPQPAWDWTTKRKGKDLA